MKKKGFEEIKERYEREKKRLEQISKGDFVWEVVPRCGDTDYHPAIVTSVNIDEAYVEVVDVSQNNIKRVYDYCNFLTEKDLLTRGFTKSDLEKEHQKYSNVRDEILNGKL